MATARENPQERHVVAPRIWLLLGDKKGDNGQVYTIADALGWPWELRHIQMRDEFVFGKPKVGPTLYHIDRARTDPLEPPWPDLILTIGRRPANVALWVKERSGGQSRIVLVGKPSGMMDRFDLIVASSENLFPPLPNVLPISLPLMRVDETAVANAAGLWSQRLGALPRPLIAVLIGGPTGPYGYNHVDIHRLISIAHDVLSQGGTPYFTSSRRTPSTVVKSLQDRLPKGSRLFAWDARVEPNENPYLGLLGCADGFIVTADSISMMTEVIRLRRPLAILPLSTGIVGRADQLRRSLARWLFAPAGGSPLDRIRGWLAGLAYHSGFITHTRDFQAFHQTLIDLGLAVLWQRGAVPPPTGQVPDDVSQVVERIREMLQEDRPLRNSARKG